MEASRIDRSAKTPLVLYDIQQRIADGTITSFVDTAVKLDSPMALTGAGTSNAQWLPDKGDLTVYKVEILRGDQTIDVLAGGDRYTVLRREADLESRVLNGTLTATLAVPGLQLGDILRIAYTVSLKDPTLNGETEGSIPLIAKPLEAGLAHQKVSWPQDTTVHWKAGPGAIKVTEGQANGDRFIAVDLPLPKPKDPPEMAPSRFTRPPMLQVGTFEDWQQVSRTFAPLYDTAGGGAALDAQVAAIVKKTADPVERAALATRFVQDHVSYLANGMSSGNYTPQAPADTLKARYGDCKAKTLLLLAMLEKMGIEAEPALVNSQFGDAVPDMLPIPGAFDHVIVKARIAERDYWLDGTSAGTRLSNIADTPTFGYVLPLRSKGAGLERIEQRIPEQPGAEITIVLDETAGIDLPPLLTLTGRISGPQGTLLHSIAEQASEEQKRELIQTFATTLYENLLFTRTAIAYDDETATATLTASGIISPAWQNNSGTIQQKLDFFPSARTYFEFDRSRPEWRDIPVVLGETKYNVILAEVLLPEGEDGYLLRGRPNLDETVALNHVQRSLSLSGNHVRGREVATSLANELPPAEIPAARAAAGRIANSVAILQAPTNAARAWQYGRPELAKRLVAHEKAYAEAIARYTSETNAWSSRAHFREGTTNFKGALADWDKVVELEPNAENFTHRAQAKAALGDFEGAAKDLREAHEMAASAETAIALAQILGKIGGTAEAVSLLDTFDDLGENHQSFVAAKADTLALAGRKDEGLALIDTLVAENPADGNVLNISCWYRARFDVGAATMLETCDRAVETTDNPFAAIDSRALAKLKAGRLEEARKDAQTGLSLNSRSYHTALVLAFVERELGEESGRKQLQYFARTFPGLVRDYETYGLKI
ncbi:DUF3857 domain-containing protein [Novosphingobium aquimarinum]|uniref:DUF3857 domain-containing protein n=1 Tax=Novosphingobium aquimarinum TaxID=2682494 RepID=UPI0018DE34BE|nr:DUF3857 domain-containing protein [Novosphingobium aquimarinum]